MTLPASGPLSLADIQGEFGGTNPISLSEYYAGGGLVPPGTTGTYGAVPSSGTISIRNFYGTSNIVVDFTTQFVFGLNFGSAQAGYQIFGAGANAGNAYQFSNFNPISFIEQWCTPTSEAGNYEVYVTNAGPALTGGTVNAWVALSTNPAWYYDVFGSGSQSSTTLFFEVRRIGTTTVIDTWDVTLQAEAF